jgi:hypothetical protein
MQPHGFQPYQKDRLLMPIKQFDVPHRAFVTRLRDAVEAVRRESGEDPWEASLRKLNGRIGADGVERVSTTDVFDHLEIPMKRRPSLTVRLSRVMRKHGWSNIRARGLNPGSYLDRVRGFAREPSSMQRPGRR